MPNHSIFSRETQVIENAESLAGNEAFSQNQLLEPYRDLLNEYKKLFRQTRRMVKMSDRMQQNLNELNAELQSHKEILSQMSYLDGLTSIANRRRFDEYLEDEWQRHCRSKLFLTLILLDLDYFKQFNDHYGHGAGDECLIKVARTIHNSVKRSVDLVARFGGEEFVIVLPQTELSGAVQVASDVQQNLRELAVPHEYSAIASIVTVSMGIAAMVPESNATSQDLVEAADRQLYEAKDAGRNQIKAKVVNNDA